MADWMPHSRTGQVSMAKVWEKGMQTNQKDWGVPDKVIETLDECIKKADAALEDVELNERTKSLTARLNAVFDALVDTMRDTRKRYIYMPPLTEEQYVQLMGRLPDTTPTQHGPPTDQVTLEFYLVGRHELGVKVVYLTGGPDNPSNKGYRIWHGVAAQGDPPPASPGELRESFFTKRKKDLIEFDFNDSGKTAYFAVQIENDGKKGPWGPLVSALIP